VGEYLAGAVIGVMVASGRALEAWAAASARRELSSLLQRAPKVGKRHTPAGVETIPLQEVEVGDLLLVGSGDVVPVDGVVVSGLAVLDESALTGEPLPVEHPAADPVRSGVVNSADPFDLRATACQADSSYAAIVRLVREAETSTAPFVRLADRYAAWFLLATLLIAGGGLGLLRTPGPGRGGAGRCHPLPPHPGGAGRHRRRAVARRAPGRGGQGRTVPGTAGPLPGPAPGQDRDPDHRPARGGRRSQRRAPAHDRDPAPRRLLGPGLLPRPGRRHRASGSPRRSNPQRADRGPGRGRLGDVRRRRGDPGRPGSGGLRRSRRGGAVGARRAPLEGAATVFVQVGPAASGVVREEPGNRDSLPVAAVPQDRGLAARRPSSADGGEEACPSRFGRDRRYGDAG
jgi:hypothetical protein